MVKKLKINLKLVTKTDYLFLFELLCERKSNMNISHKKLPTYKQHVKFVMSKPYFRWYIIKNNSKSIGSIYLTDRDEIGIFLKRQVQGIGVGHNVLKMIMKKHPRERYIANINPKNHKSIQFFKKNGFKLIQHSYKFEK